MSTNKFGWIPFPDRDQAQNAANDRALAGMPAFEIYGYREEKGRFALWQAAKSMFGKHMPYIWQTTGSCFPAGTPIRMADGTEKVIESVEAGDEVVSHTGSTRLVRETMRRKYTGEMISVQLIGHPFPLEMTSDHKVAVWREDSQWDLSKGKLEWVDAGSLQEKDRLILSLPKTEEIREGDGSRIPFGYARRIRKLERRNVTDLPVFDFEVDIDHSFVANSIVVHNCVGAGGGNVLRTTMCVEITNGDAEEFLNIWWPFTYGQSRLRAGMRGRGEGSLGSTWAEAITKDGIFAHDKSQLPDFRNIDGWLQLPESVEYDWSAGERVDSKWRTLAKNHLINTAARIRSAEEAKAALQNGYALTLASMFGTRGGRLTGTPEVRLAEWDDRWAHQMFCLSGDTKIPLLDNSEKTLKELTDTGEKIWIYSYDHDTGTVVPKEARAKQTRPSSPDGMVRVVLDNGELVTATPDHKFMTRSGLWVEAQNLRPGDSLMPLYRRFSTKDDCKHRVGYEMVMDPVTDSWVFTHKRVAESVGLSGLRFREGIYFEEPNPGKAMATIHHLDFNKTNNDPRNLRMMLKTEHWLSHAYTADPSHMWKARLDPAYCKRQAEAARKSLLKLRRDPLFLAKLKRAASVNMTRLNEDPKFIEKRSLAASKTMKKLRNDPVFIEAMLQGVRKFNSSLETRAKRSASNRLRSADPEFRKLLGRSISLSLSNPEIRDKLSKAATIRGSNPDYQEKQRVAQIKRFADPKARAAHSDSLKQWWADKKASSTVVNHKVAAVIFLPNETGPTYCLEVDGTHNFAVSAGVFVHNCDEAWDHPTIGLIFRIGNNWGPEAHGSPTQGEPPGGFYTTAKTFDRVCKTGEVFAYSAFSGFPARVINWFI